MFFFLNCYYYYRYLFASQVKWGYQTGEEGRGVKKEYGEVEGGTKVGDRNKRREGRRRQQQRRATRATSNVITKTRQTKMMNNNKKKTKLSETKKQQHTSLLKHLIF